MSGAKAGHVEIKTEKPSRKPTIILIAGMVILVFAITGGLWFYGFSPFKHSSINHSKNQLTTVKPIFVDVPDIVTNLDNGSHRDVFIKLRARIEVANKADQMVLMANMSSVLDAFQTYLRSTRPEEIQGGEGTYRLREALMNRIDIIATPVSVINVLFVEMLIQ